MGPWQKRVFALANLSVIDTNAGGFSALWLRRRSGEERWAPRSRTRSGSAPVPVVPLTPLPSCDRRSHSRVQTADAQAVKKERRTARHGSIRPSSRGVGPPFGRPRAASVRLTVAPNLRSSDSNPGLRRCSAMRSGSRVWPDGERFAGRATEGLIAAAACAKVLRPAQLRVHARDARTGPPVATGAAHGTASADRDVIVWMRRRSSLGGAGEPRRVVPWG